MTSIDEAAYIEQRVDNQLEWYSRKSSQNQTNYKRLRVIEILAAALIPFLSGYTSRASFVEFIVGGLGVLIAVIAGILSLNRFQENWTDYRATAEALKREKFLYQTRSEPYTVTEPFPLFVQRIETILSEENTSWTTQMKASAEETTQN